MRQAIQVEIHGNKLVGTYHVPFENKKYIERVSADAIKMRKLGILVTNFAQLPRSGLGNMSVNFADKLADIGFPVFRIDLPGLGDSKGDLPTYVQQHWSQIIKGDHTQWICGIVHKLKEEYDLEKFILVGLCGSAITAIYAMERLPNSISGLILMEPTYHSLGISEDMGNAKIRNNISMIKENNDKGKIVLNNWLNKIKNSNRYKNISLKFRVMVTNIIGHHPPTDCNLKFYRYLKKMIKLDVPILFITQDGIFRELYDFKYLGISKNHVANNIIWKTIKNTNHMLVSGGGKEKVSAYIENWVSELFDRLKKEK